MQTVTPSLSLNLWFPSDARELFDSFLDDLSPIPGLGRQLSPRQVQCTAEFWLPAVAAAVLGGTDAMRAFFSEMLALSYSPLVPPAAAELVTCFLPQPCAHPKAQAPETVAKYAAYFKAMEVESRRRYLAVYFDLVIAYALAQEATVQAKDAADFVRKCLLR